MLKFADVSYFQHKAFDNLSAVLKTIDLSLVYLNSLKQHADIQVIQHGIPKEEINRHGVKFTGFPGGSSFFHIPVKAHKQLKQFNPDVVLVQGLIFPVQTWLLRRALGPQVVILVQHHGESPFVSNLKWFFQRLADKAIDGYLFTAKGNAEQWVRAGVISNISKVYEVLECSTQLRPRDKEESKKKLDMSGQFNFLSVGRLNAGKDPLTVLEGFEQFLSQQPGAKLYMIYQTEELLGQIKERLAASKTLKDAVRLIGKVPHSELATWYSAADFFISGSHHEGSGYALIEAMACGCIPVVTRIPSFGAITGYGKYAFNFEAGNAAGLAKTLSSLQTVNKQELSQKLMQHFNSELSFNKIADDILKIATELRRTKG
ncbi:glycosyltransferase family 4 protein [Polluticoccus soli]|uniref:glycosyltransferase family 4 protein n=1 Tax=Polluticoccus soli TaxID=3034150 RepID=UPI0023E20048|nr:glycosyltransferase family 4 protein [Flavipsychrobacter sp. JY13-12]